MFKNGVSEYTEHMLKKTIALQKKEQNKLIAELKRMPPGVLYIKKRGERFFAYEKLDGCEKAITKDKRKLEILARKLVVKQQIRCIQNDMTILQESLRQITEYRSKESKLPGNKSLCALDKFVPKDEFLLSKKIHRWKNQYQERNLYKEEERRYKTNGGLMVRSKSERTIVNRFEERGLVFCYEAEIIIDGDVYYPDFLILKPNGEILIWEHFGLTDDPEYYSRMVNKIELYRQEGFCQHSNFICTREEDIVDIDKLDEIIDRFVYS